MVAFCSESHIKYSYTLCWLKVEIFLTLNLVVKIVTTRPQRVGEVKILTLCWKNFGFFLTLNLVVNIVTTRPQRVGEVKIHTLCWKNFGFFLTLNLVVNIVTTRLQRVGEARRCDWYNDYAMGCASKELWFDCWQRQVILSSTKHPHRL